MDGEGISPEDLVRGILQRSDADRYAHMIHLMTYFGVLALKDTGDVAVALSAALTTVIAQAEVDESLASPLEQVVDSMAEAIKLDARDAVERVRVMTAVDSTDSNITSIFDAMGKGKNKH